MKFKFFTISISDDGSAEQEVNNFLAQYRILHVERQFVQNGDHSAWTFCISYAETSAADSTNKRSKIDYKEVLNSEEFAVYARLRELRKSLSEKEGVPLYALFNNDQLAALVQRRVQTETAMQQIDGVGQTKVKKYGTPFLKLLRELFENEEKSDKS